MSLVLLDTDMLSEILKLKDPVVIQHALAYTQAVGQLAFSAVTRYEVRRGYKRKNAIQQMAKFQVFCQNASILSVTDPIWDRAADLWALGDAGGHPHNDTDIIIAATALEEGRTLATGNTSHFAWIPGLAIVDWRQP